MPQGRGSLVSFRDVRTARKHCAALGSLARVVRVEGGFAILELPPSRGLPAILRTSPGEFRKITSAEALELTAAMVTAEPGPPGRPRVPEAERLAPVTVWLSQAHLDALDARGERSRVIRGLVEELAKAPKGER